MSSRWLWLCTMLWLAYYAFVSTDIDQGRHIDYANPSQGFLYDIWTKSKTFDILRDSTRQFITSHESTENQIIRHRDSVTSNIGGTKGSCRSFGQLPAPFPARCLLLEQISPQPNPIFLTIMTRPMPIVPRWP